MSEDLIIKYFEKQSLYSDKEGTNLGLIVDTETTGLQSDAEIIEICILPFMFTDEMEITKVFKPYNGFEQSSAPLTGEIKSITGLTDEMIAGKAFDDGAVNALFNRAEIAIAHNAGFDRPKMENRFPTLKKIVWACSAKDPDWGSMHIASRALDYIAFRLGFHFNHHRAENDCRATLHILSHSLPTGKTAFQSLVERAFTPDIKLSVKSEIAFKDMLKGRGYSWAFKDKRWEKGFTEDEIEAEMKWLNERIPNAEVSRKVTDLKKRYA